MNGKLTAHYFVHFGVRSVSEIQLKGKERAELQEQSLNFGIWPEKISSILKPHETFILT